MAWIDVVVDAFINLGGDAFLKDIYIEVKRKNEHLTGSYDAIIRRVIEEHSTDSNSYKPRNENLFYSIDGIGSGHWGYLRYQPNETTLACTQDDAHFSEGKATIKQHIIRERNPRLIKAVKQRFIEEHGCLYCEVCHLNFEDKYGEIGRNFIEAHHIIPVSSLSDDSVTRVEDIVLLCSNCHSMIHRKKPWLTKSQLSRLITKETS